jgi:alpha-L-rhamnosidase
MNKRDEPGYGHWLELGATTSREQWSEEGSHNHPMFGGGLVWYYRKLAGMNADSEKPGYRHIIFKPQPAGDLTFVKYSNQTSYGETGISWKKSNEEFSMEIDVPVSSSATVYVPAEEGKTVFENGVSPTESKDIHFMGEENGYQLFVVKSGKYNFVVK